MTDSQKIKEFLSETASISIGYNELNFFSPTDLEDEQIGYSVDDKGNSLIKGQIGDWENSWVVIGYDSLGDPIIVDCSDPILPVLTSQHGQGEWELILIANNLENFKQIIQDLSALSIGRQSPDEMESNPVSKIDVENFTKNIKNNNSSVDVGYWESILQDE